MRTVYFVITFIVRPRHGGHELLLGRRAAEKTYMGGTWQLISGQIEPNESAWQAALREIEEETALPIRALYRLTSVASFYRADIDAICVGVDFCAVVDADAEPTINAEHTHLEWVPIDRARDRLMWPSDRAALNEVRTQILADGPIKAHLRIDLPSPA